MATHISVGNPMDRGAWQATVHVVARVGHKLATKPPPLNHTGFIEVETYKFSQLVRNENKFSTQDPYSSSSWPHSIAFSPHGGKWMCRGLWNVLWRKPRRLRVADSNSITFGSLKLQNRDSFLGSLKAFQLLRNDLLNQTKTKILSLYQNTF